MDEQRGQMTESYSQEVFYEGGGLEAGELARDAEVILDVEALDGRIRFVRQGASPMIGVLAEGHSARKVTTHLFETYSTTPLEVLEVFAPTDYAVPETLVLDHGFWAQMQHRSPEERSVLPPIDQLVAEAVDTTFGPGLGQDCKEPSGGNCWERFVDKSACGDDRLDYFQFWFKDNPPKHASYGANGISGSGYHEGPVNPIGNPPDTGNTTVTLGPSSRGLVVACGHGDTTPYTIEYHMWLQGIGWSMFSKPFAPRQFANGMRYRGFGLHQIRMVIRVPGPGQAKFFWGGSY